MTCRIFSLLLLFAFVSKAQNVQTILDTTFEIDDALILDKAGNLYGSNFDGDAVYKLTPSGQISVFANGMGTPNGLAFDSQENLHVVDPSVSRVYKISYSGVFLDTFNIPGASGIIKQRSSDTMYVATYSNQSVYKLAPDGNTTLWKQGTPLNGPVGFTYDDMGQLYVGNFNDRRILRLDEDTVEYIATIPGRANGTGWLGFIAYANGAIYGTSFSAHKIYKVYPEYKDSVEWFAGSNGGTVDGPIQQAQFHGPNGILASITGDTIYVSDYQFGRVRMITDIINLDLPVCSTGVNTGLSIYPNPVNSRLQLEVMSHLQSEDLLISIYGPDGKLVYQLKDQTGESYFPVDVGNWAKGIYLVKVKVANRIFSQRFIHY